MDWMLGVGIAAAVALLAVVGGWAWRSRQRKQQAEEFLRAVEAFGEERPPAPAASSAPVRARLVFERGLDFESVGDALSSVGCEAVPGSWVHGDHREPRGHAWTCRDLRVDYERDDEVRRLVVSGGPEGREFARTVRDLLPVLEPEDLVRQLSTTTYRDSLQYLLRAGAWRFSGEDSALADRFRELAHELTAHDDHRVAAVAREVLRPDN